MLILAAQTNTVAVAAITAGATLTAAVFIAIVTAITTDRRQEKALGHDRDLADLRELVDEAAIVVNDAGDALDRLTEAVMKASPEKPQPAAVMMARDDVRIVRNRLDAINARVRVRVGEASPLTVHVQGCVDAVHFGWLAGGTSDLGKMFQLVDAARDAWQESASAFVDAAVARIGVAEPPAAPTSVPIMAPLIPLPSRILR